MASDTGLTAANFPQSAPIDNSAAGIQYQHYQTDLRARGAGVSLGIGRRSVPSPSSQFSTPPLPLSNDQFSGSPGGSNGRLTGGDEA